VRGISSKNYNALRENEYKPLFNKTVQGVYPPGSTFKMMTALAALRAGVIGPQERVWCPGHMTVGRRRFHCWKRGGHGWMNLDDAVTQSCDVYFYEASKRFAERFGIEALSEICHEFGLGERFDLPLSAIEEGLIPTTKWKLRMRDEPWLPGDTLNSSIGQDKALTNGGVQRVARQ
ncbi:MAG: penicillin-binding transpeptidase domain-containing protein, partial [Myxococcota bacterium]